MERRVGRGVWLQEGGALKDWGVWVLGVRSPVLDGSMAGGGGSSAVQGSNECDATPVQERISHRS